MPENGIVKLLSNLPGPRLVCDTPHMNTPSANRYTHHRIPAEIIAPKARTGPLAIGERRTQGFTPPGHVQCFLLACGLIAQYFRPRHHLLPAARYRREMRQRFLTWRDIMSLPTPA